MAQRLTLNFKKVEFQEPDAADLGSYGQEGKGKAALSAETLAIRIAEGKGPAVVRFVNEAGVESCKDKALAKACQDSKNVIDLFGIGNQDLCMVARLFSLYSADLQEVDAKKSPLVNELTVPIVVVLDAEGKVVKTLTGSVRLGEMMSAMAQAVKSKISLDRVLAEERKILRDVLALDSLKSTLDSKRKALETAKGPALQKLEAEIKKLEDKVAAEEIRIQECESKLLGSG